MVSAHIFFFLLWWGGGGSGEMCFMRLIDEMQVSHYKVLIKFSFIPPM